MRQAAAVKKLFLLEGSSSKIFLSGVESFLLTLGSWRDGRLKPITFPVEDFPFILFFFGGDACPLAARLTGALKEL